MKRTASEVAGILRAFVDDSGGEWDWDDFISQPISDPALDAIRARCAGLPEEFPTATPGWYCGEAGLEVIRYYASQLSAPASRA